MLEPTSIHPDEPWMRLALEQAECAQAQNEVPVGAVVVVGNELVGSGYNQMISLCDPSAHAEILALRDAAQNLGNYRLPDATLYVTLEPCTMCLGALIHSRIARLVFGAAEPKAGAVISHPLIDRDMFNHKVEFSQGVLAQDCGNLLSAFFAGRRKEKQERLQ